MIKFWWETEFKETEIGKIPGDWEVKKMRDLFKIESGRRPPEVNDNGKFEVWGANGFMGYITSYNYCGEFLITGRVGTLGHVFYIPENIKIWVSDNALIITKDKDKVIVKLYFYYLKTRKREIEELNVGSTQPLITQRDLKEIKIPYPPPPEQSRIATVLSWFDDLIENKKRQNEVLEKVAMAIFKSWFVDFEPFKDEKFVYNEELGKEIPKGWEVKKLGEFVSTQYGFTASGEETGKIKLLRIKDINKAFVIDWDSVPFCNITNDIFPKYRLKNMDIVISRIGDIGKVAIVENPPLSVFASYLIKLKIKNHKLTPYYLYYWLKAPDYQEYIQGAAEGSTRPNTNAEVIKAGPILIPPSSLIEKFEEVVFPIRSKIILNQKQIMVLRKIRDALLPKLVFGKLRVEEV